MTTEGGSPDVAAGVKVLNESGGLPGSGLHSWRCEDKTRYPNPCTCVEDVVREIIAAVWVDG